MREISRISKAVGREDTADHCEYAASTAWHLVDWIWADIIARDVVLKHKLAKEAGVRPTKFDLEDFKLFVMSEGQCRELAYLRLITDESKHSAVKKFGGDPVFETIASFKQPETHGIDWLPTVHESSSTDWTFKIVDRENRGAFVDLVIGAHDYLERFIDDHGMGSD